MDETLTAECLPAPDEYTEPGHTDCDARIGRLTAEVNRLRAAVTGDTARRLIRQVENRRRLCSLTTCSIDERLKVEAGGRHAGIQLPAGSWWDWDVVAWSASQLRLAAGHDVTYHHGLELVFDDPIFVSCPTSFHDPIFRAPSSDEILKVTRHFGGDPLVVIAFEADAGGQEPVSCLIAAEGLVIVQETVLRYWREDAAPGQRFAAWVQASGQ
ncbi:hypothetical protein [Streptomyces sp. NPDC018031]|uniref:hypothetical protein n=1 Tax=Streptomyces sp. NPDC018031 TaxID=3365033 RepID=UPI00378FAFF9